MRIPGLASPPLPPLAPRLSITEPGYTGVHADTAKSVNRIVYKIRAARLE